MYDGGGALECEANGLDIPAGFAGLRVAGAGDIGWSSRDSGERSGTMDLLDLPDIFDRVLGVRLDDFESRVDLRVKRLNGIL